MKIITEFSEFSKISESLVQKRSLDQLKMVRKLSKSTDIGDRISDMNDEGANLHYMKNAIDDGVETFQDFEAKNKKFITGWNFKNLTDPFTGNK
jgi:hypothetical protein